MWTGHSTRLRIQYAGKKVKDIESRAVLRTYKYSGTRNESITHMHGRSRDDFPDAALYPYSSRKGCGWELATWMIYRGLFSRRVAPANPGRGFRRIPRRMLWDNFTTYRIQGMKV